MGLWSVGIGANFVQSEIEIRQLPFVSDSSADTLEPPAKNVARNNPKRILAGLLSHLTVKQSESARGVGLSDILHHVVSLLLSPVFV